MYRPCPETGIIVLSVDGRPKHTLTSVDLFCLLEWHWRHDDKVYLHDRYRVQLALILQLLSYTANRPGALIESSCYKGTNEALKYKVRYSPDLNSLNDVY
jgi:hypothetical protein